MLRCVSSLVAAACLAGSVAHAQSSSPTLLQSALAPRSTVPLQSELDGADRDDNNWLMYNKGYLGYRYTALTDISAKTATAVKVLCSTDLAYVGRFQSGLVVYGGVIYATAASTTYAVDAATCAMKWTYTYPAAIGGDAVNRGAALSQGRLFRGTGDGHLLALDAITGALLWNRQVANAGIGEFVAGAPLAWNGLVFVGKSGGDFGTQGEVMAFNAVNGTQVWSFHTVPNVPDTGSSTWPNQSTIAHGGGATWSTFALDKARKLLLIPVGNPEPAEYKSGRPGANLFTNSIVALNAETGALSWWHQLLPHDDRDWDTTVVAASPTAGGRDIAVAAGKNGVLHAVDRSTGVLIYTVPLVLNYLNTATPVPSGAGIRICPFTAVLWNGPTYSPATNMLYINGNDWCTQAIQGPKPVFKVGQTYAGWANGEGGTPDPLSTAFGVITAIDASTGAVMWRTTLPTVSLGGLVATGGGVLVSSDIGGRVMLLDATSGAELAAINVGQPIAGGLASYTVGGRQRLAVAAGLSSSDYGANGTATIMVLGIP